MKYVYSIVAMLSLALIFSCHGSEDQGTSSNDSSALQMQSKILGTWASIGDQRATFVIDKGKIFYPDQNQSYSYHLFKDSIRIRYKELQVNYLIRTKGPDTLILVGTDAEVFYRFSN